MSTAYRIAGRGRVLTLAHLTTMVKEAGGMVNKPRVEQCTDPARARIIQLDGQYIWIHQTGKQVWHEFERYGGNDPRPFIDLLELHGYGWLSEHDEGFSN